MYPIFVDNEDCSVMTFLNEIYPLIIVYILHWYIFPIINKSHKKNKTNSVLVLNTFCLPEPVCGSQPKPIGSYWRHKSLKMGHEHIVSL